MDLQKTIELLLKQARHIAEGHDMVLDFSDESIQGVSELLDFYHESYLEAGENIIKEQPDTFAHIWGVYVGEILRRNYGPSWAWEKAEYGLVLAKNEKNMINPVGKAHKHIVNGKEDGDDIGGFFSVAILFLQDKFPSGNTPN